MRVGEPELRVGQDPREQALRLHRVREQALRGQGPGSAVRDVIAAFWKRLRHKGFDPQG